LTSQRSLVPPSSGSSNMQALLPPKHLWVLTRWHRITSSKIWVLRKCILCLGSLTILKGTELPRYKWWTVSLIYKGNWKDFVSVLGCPPSSRTEFQECVLFLHVRHFTVHCVTVLHKATFLSKWTWNSSLLQRGFSQKTLPTMLLNQYMHSYGTFSILNLFPDSWIIPCMLCVTKCGKKQWNKKPKRVKRGNSRWTFWPHGTKPASSKKVKCIVWNFVKAFWCSGWEASWLNKSIPFLI
jgi:hypothetical protein